MAAGVTKRSVAAGLAGAALVGALVAAVVEPNRSPWPPGVDLPAVEADGTRTFSINPGQDVTFPPGAARPADVVVCEGRGSVTVGPPESEAVDPSGIVAESDGDGRLRVRCEGTG